MTLLSHIDQRAGRRWLVDSVMIRLFALAQAILTARLMTTENESLTRVMFDAAGVIGDALLVVFLLFIALLALDIIVGAQPRRAPWLRVLPIEMVGAVYIYMAAAAMTGNVRPGGPDLIIYYAAIGAVFMLAGLSTAINMLEAARRESARQHDAQTA